MTKLKSSSWIKLKISCIHPILFEKTTKRKIKPIIRKEHSMPCTVHEPADWAFS